MKQISTPDENSLKSFKYKIDYGNFLNNTTRTIKNLNLDFKINFKDDESTYRMGLFNNFSMMPYYKYEKPLINRNFLREEKIKMNASPTVINDYENKIPSTVIKVQCNCKKSKCLKLYCECFAYQSFCQNCNCVDCHNIDAEEYKKERKEIINSIKEKNPNAFLEKLDTNFLKHAKGCNCTKSNCMKKYCECFQKGLGCSEICRCRECKNKKEKVGIIVKNNIILNDTENFDSISYENINYNAGLNLKNKSNEFQIENTSIFLNSSKAEDSKTKKENFNFMVNFREKSKNNKMIKKKRSRGSLKKLKYVSSSHSKKMTDSAIKRNKDIISLLTRIPSNNNSQINQTNLKLEGLHPLTTPKKPNKNFNCLTSNKKSSATGKNFNTSEKSIKKSNKNYKDTTLSHMITTAPATSKRRTATKLNSKEFDKSIVKKLNMNVNNEPLFGSKK